ncbi:hypothetical protein CICLE_v10006459mg, partial [Citrus x clementina]
FIRAKHAQEGFTRLWRGTYASLALSVPTVGIYLSCYDSFRNLMENFTTGNAPLLTPYVPLVAGSVARSLACISCYPIKLARTQMQVYLNSLLAMLLMSLILNCQIGCLKID